MTTHDCGGSWRHRFAVLFLVCLASAAGAGRAEAQLGALISPGRLTRAHAGLEGIANCVKCHEKGRKVTAEKCLVCHRPIADRIARHVGVHRDVKDECVSCHSEHTGLNGELRPFDESHFDHAVTGFPLDGKHAPLAMQCAACHKVRSFLTLSPSCVSCHADVHKGQLGATCTACHSTRVAFKELGGQFDHAKSAFPLVGAHRTVACAACHVNNRFKGLKFAACTDCHRDPHPPAFGATCTACHTNDSWRTTKIDHARTGYPLVGRHATVRCASCHRQPAMRVKLNAATCSACHADPHRGAFKQDCKACHSESGFSKAPFDHSTTAFALTGKHEGLACAACHKNVVTAGRPAAKRVADFRGLTTACVSCHADVHRGELGTTCESCHSTAGFHLATYTHRRFPEFFGGQHASVACVKCHAAPTASHVVAAVDRNATRREGTTTEASLNLRFANLSTACASCHADAHLGQEGSSCERCHTVQVAHFAVTAFPHESTPFPLTGRHKALACAACHKPETGTFPAGRGTAVRLKGLAHECRACHADVHLGQFAAACETCHATTSFKLPGYKHRSRALAGFFTGQHAKAPCAACHKPIAADFPQGRGTAIRFKEDTRCVACHEDVHRGSLGRDCGSCHRP